MLLHIINCVCLKSLQKNIVMASPTINLRLHKACKNQ